MRDGVGGLWRKGLWRNSVLLCCSIKQHDIHTTITIIYTYLHTFIEYLKKLKKLNLQTITMD